MCLGLLSCWNLLPSLRFWMLWTGFSLRLSQYFGALSFSSILMSPAVPAAEKQPHSMRLLPAHFTFGMYSAGDEQSWFLQTWCLELRFIRPETTTVAYYRNWPALEALNRLVILIHLTVSSPRFLSFLGSCASTLFKTVRRRQGTDVKRGAASQD